MIEILRQRSRPYLFSNSIPPMIAAAGIAMFVGRYVTLILQLAIVASLMAKQKVNDSIGSLKTDTMTFTTVLFVIVIVISALTFLPVLVLGPIAEFLKMRG